MPDEMTPSQPLTTAAVVAVLSAAGLPGGGARPARAPVITADLAGAPSAGHVRIFPGIAVPRQITAGPDGALWFTNTFNNTIGRITTTVTP